MHSLLPPTTGVGHQSLDDVLRDGSVHTHFQPIVELESGSVVGYEALSRGPVGALQRPDLLFDAARAAGRLGELDELCRRTALSSAIDAALFAPTTLFVNIEPEALEQSRLDDLIALARQAPGQLQIVLEITERAIAARPADLLATARRLRGAGWRIALDDVGADDMSLAFMPLLRPDVVKLDLRLVQERPGPAVAEIMNAVNAYAERSGAVLLAEGIEDETHLQLARALGARLGQGWMYGRPAPTVTSPDSRAALHLPRLDTAPLASSPFDCVPDGTELRTSTKPLLVEVSKHLEREAMRFGRTCVVLATFQEAQHFTRPTARRYRTLVAHAAFVAAIGEGLDPEPLPGLRGADLRADDPVRGEWDLVVLAPHFAGALLARDLGDEGPEDSRRFEFALTYDRDVVVAAAQTLMSRVLPRGMEWTGQPDPRAHAAPAATRVPGAAAAPRGEGDVELNLQRALAATTNGVSIADATRPDQPLIYVNAAFERLSGLRAEDVIGRNCRVLQGPETDRAAIARIRAAIEEGREIRETIVNYRGPDREPWWNEIYLAPVYDDRNQLTHYIGVQSDVTARIAAERELEDERRRSMAYLNEVEALAFRDPLTGLLNRRRLQETLQTVIERAADEGTSVAVLYLDLDNFKAINDRHGHAAGDAVLRTTAERLQDSLQPSDVVARMGGDEFLVVVPGLAGAGVLRRAENIVTECLDRLRAPIETGIAGMDPLRATFSAGVSVYPDDGRTFDDLVHAADQRMYANKPASAAVGYIRPA